MTQVLAGRNALVSGGTRGLGLAISHAYVQAGANVIICGRDQDMLESSVHELREQATVGQQVHGVPANVADPEQVARLVETAIERFGSLQILVSNAGIYGPIGPLDSTEWSAWRYAIEVDLFGPVLLARSVIPHFRQRSYGKIVQLSGGGATKPLPGLTAYSAAKAGVVRFAETLAAELQREGIDVNAIAPGALNTRLLDEVIAAGPKGSSPSFYAQAMHQAKQGGTPLVHGADLAVFLGSAASDGISGKLISCVWDPWRQFPEVRDKLMDSDVYTLRRVSPEDRGLQW